MGRIGRRQPGIAVLTIVTGSLLLITGFITSTFGSDKRAPLWVIIAGGVGVAVGIVQLFIGYAQKRAEVLKADDAWTVKVRSLVAEWPLPRLSEVDPYQLLGVTESELARHYLSPGGRPPYVLRDIDSELDRTLTMNDRVLLVGHSKSGKSRTAFEAALRLFPQQPLIIPADGKALVEFFHLDPPVEWDSGPAILWLDDLQRFLGPNGLNLSLLNTLAQDKYQGRLKLVATVTTKRYDEYLSSSSDIAKDMQLVLRRFHELHLASELTPSEAQRAQAAYPREPLERLSQGLGEHLIAARELTKKFDTGRVTHPQGYALVRAAIDWRRAGLVRPIPETALRKLSTQYLSLLELPHVDMTARSFQEGLRWAREPIGLHVALLSRKGEDTPKRRFEAFDYLVDSAERQEVALPDKACELMLDFASPNDALLVGLTAVRRESRAIAQRAFTQALAAQSLDASSWANCFLGILAHESRDLAEAERFYRKAFESPQASGAPLAMNNLGKIELDRGNLSEAERLFRAAIDSKQQPAVALAMNNLGTILRSRGELAEAERLYRAAIDSKDPDAVAMASTNLGSLLLSRGEQAQAESLYREAIGAHRPDAAAWAMNNLGSLLLSRGEQAEAERFFLRAVEARNPDVSPVAALRLGTLLQGRGELSEAERFYKLALASRQPDTIALATYGLGTVHQGRGELADAERLFRAVIDSQHPFAMGWAMNNLGGILQARGELAEAERLFRAALQSPLPDAAALAKLNLGSLFHTQGAIAEAERFYQAAIDSFQPNAAAMAANNLGKLRQDQGNLAEAERLYQFAIASQRPEAVAMASLNLGKLQQAQGKLAEAARLYQAARHSEVADIVEQATAALESLTGGGVSAESPQPSA